jgi:hypothetical protein
MKKLTLVLLAVLVLVSLSFAQEGNKTKQGNLGWVFTLNGLTFLRADNFRGTNAGNTIGTVGAKYYIQDDLAIRGGIGFSTESITGQTNNRSDFTVNGGITYNYSSSGPVVGYLGGMLTYGSIKNSGDSTSSTTFGIAGLAGAEWFPWNSVSLGAEYQLAWRTDKAAGSDNSNSYFDLGTASSYNLILTFYVK